MGLLDKPGFCSLYIAVDNHYLDKLLVSYPTWVHCHPEILNMDHVFVYDNQEVTVHDARWGKLNGMRRRALAAIGRQLTTEDRTYLVPWSMDHSDGVSQREEMLTGLVRCAESIRTPWYLKLDADTYANKKTGFYYDKWFEGNPCYISNPWGYAKPGDQIDLMNAWAKTVPEIRDLPDVRGTKVWRESPPETPPWKVNWPRMASWVQFGNTGWTQWCSSLCPKDERLPTPSQDTYLSFLQRRTSALWVPVKFRSYGWEHSKGFDNLRHSCRLILESLGVSP